MAEQALNEGAEAGELLLNSAEAARVLGVSPQSIRNFHKLGKLPGHKVGDSHYVFKRSDVLEFGHKRVAHSGVAKRHRGSKASK